LTERCRSSVIQFNGDALKSDGRFVYQVSISSRLMSFVCAPTPCTTDAALMTPRRSASREGMPSSMKATVVEAVASPAPVRETGGAGSGYIGTCHAPSSSRIFHPFGPSVTTTIFGPKARRPSISFFTSLSVVLRISCASSLLQKNIEVTA